MGSRFFLLLFLAQAAVIGAVVVAFKVFEPRPAGLVASVMFLTLGLVTLVKLPAPRVRFGTFWATLLYLFGSVFPILITRLMFWELEFRDVTIFGIPGPKYHGISGTIYLAMMAATFIDLLRLRWRRQSV